MPRRRTPAQRRPIWAPWSKAGRAGCPLCGDPVEYVHLTWDPERDDGTRVAVERRVDHQHGTIAARFVLDKMVGHRITKLRPCGDGFIPVREHAQVCSEAVPATVQQPLPGITTTEKESTT